MCAIQNAHWESGLPTPLLQPIRMALRGFRRLRVQPKDHRLPVDLNTLRHIKNSLRISDLPTDEQLLLW